MSHPLAKMSVPLWPLPVIIAVLPLVATWTAFALSAQAGFVDACNPFWDGCTSISRAARHGLGNHVFRAVMLPCATLQILFWLAARHWLRYDGRAGGRHLPWLGLVAGTFLILYATFLGTEGEIYQLLRRYGVTVYFAATYLALLQVLRATAGPTADSAHRILVVIAAGMLVLGIGNVAVGAIVDTEAAKDRWQNVTEWHLGLWLTAMFAVFAWRWRQLRTRLA